MEKKRFCLTILSFLLLTASVSQADGWLPLFNGENLDGWRVHGDPEWRIKDGHIVVDGVGKEMGWLVSEGSYDNFVFSARFKWYGGNSGIQVRSQLEGLDGKRMVGYQANLDPGRTFATGSILYENGRGKRIETKVPADKLFKKDEWNVYEIAVLGDRYIIHVNGIETVDMKDPNGDSSGIVALQMAPGEGAKMEWSDIRILPLPKNSRSLSMFNGEDLSGWETLGNPVWDVEDGCIVGRSMTENEGYGWLVSIKEYSNFHFTTRFKIAKGNSGVQFRSWQVDNMIHGFQADIASGSDWINGHLYDQSEKGVLVRPNQDFSKLIDWNGWNIYEITAIGPKVELFINGVKSIEHTDPERLKGIFAFQIHAGQAMETRWNDIRIIPIP